MQPSDRPVDSTPPPRPAAPSRRGFAIIISVTLLSFIILLLLALVQMTRVGTQSSAAALQDEQAKRNALFGLDMAVSQLEKFAGPDQRTTVRADFGDISLNRDMAQIRFPQSNPQTGTIAEPEQFFTDVQVPYSANLVPMGLPQTFAPGTKMWTAVLGNADPGGLIFVKTPVKVLLTWLVSGNELDQAASTLTLSSGLYGQIDAFGSIPTETDGTIAYPGKYTSYIKGLYATPDGAVTNVSRLDSIVTTTFSLASLSSNQLQITSANGGTFRGVLLVGPATTGTQSNESISYSTGNLITLEGRSTDIEPTGQSVTVSTAMADRFVVAPLVNLSVSSNLIQGFSGTAPKAVGSYGWAVLDEGIKAKVNIRDDYDTGGDPISQKALLGTSGSATSTYAARLRMQVMPRFGIETVTGMRPTGTVDDIPSSQQDFYPVDASVQSSATLSSTSSFAVSRIFSLPQLRYTDPSSGGALLSNNASGSGALPVMLRYHDLTTYSYGVLADSQRGGLRRDLTAILGDDAVFANYGASGSAGGSGNNGVNILPDFDEPLFNSASISIPVGGVNYSLDPGEQDPALQDPAYAEDNPTTTNPSNTVTLSGRRVSPKSQYIYGTSIGEADGEVVPVENHAPTWDKIRNFYYDGLNYTPSGSSSATASPVIVQAADARHAPLTPVILQCRVFFNAGHISGTGTFALRVYVAIVVANPYSAPIQAPLGVNFVFREPGLPVGVGGVNGATNATTPPKGDLFPGGRGAWIVALSDWDDYPPGTTTLGGSPNSGPLVGQINGPPSAPPPLIGPTENIQSTGAGAASLEEGAGGIAFNPADVNWTLGMLQPGFTFSNNGFFRAYYFYATQGFGYPILNSGMSNFAGNSTDAFYRFERNWKALPDPAPSILGSVVLHASDRGKFGNSLTIPAGEAEVLVVCGLNSPIFGSGANNAITTDLTRDVLGNQLGNAPMVFDSTKEVEMVPVTDLPITETVSTTATASTVSISGSGLSLADFYYVYDTQLLPGTIPFTNRFSQALNGDNVSLYMLDPNYGSGTPGSNVFLPGDNRSNYTANGGFYVGRPLTAVVGAQYEDGGRPPGNEGGALGQMVGAKDIQLTKGATVTNPNTYAYVSSMDGSGSSTQGISSSQEGYQPQLTGYDGGSFFFQVDLPESRTLWVQATGGTKLFRGNFYRTLIDYGLTNVFHAQPMSTGTAFLGAGAKPLPPNALAGYIGWLMGVFKQDNDASRPWGFNLYSLDYASSIGWADNVSSAYSESATVFDDLPRRLYNQPSSNLGNREEPILSIGYLRHLNLSGDDEYMNPGYQPDSQIGNSYFNPYLTRLATVQQVTNYLEPSPTTYTAGANKGVLPTVEVYDMTYLLNAALWDTYFFSTIPLDSNSGLPNNRRLKFAAGINPTLAELGVGPGFADTVNPSSGSPNVPDAVMPGIQIPKEYAASRSLLIDGAFNVNSTSIEAWRALLSGLRGRAAGGTDTQLLQKLSAFPRTLFEPFVPNGFGGQRSFSADSNLADATALNNNSTMNAYAGFRRLTDEQIEALAVNIVLEIRKRGPVISLAEFINRSDVSNVVTTGGSYYNIDALAAVGLNLTFGNETVPALQDTDNMAGRLQIAIERSGLNSAQPNEIEPEDRDVPSNTYDQEFESEGSNGRGPIIPSLDYASGIGDDDTDSLHNPLYQDYFPQAGTFAQATLNRSVGIPGWFCQADLLQPLGPVLAARSDTFVVRAYGDIFDIVNTINPNTPIVLGRAWCEAVVQREPDYVDAADVPSTYPAFAKPDNVMFGRKFRIVSFRWLSPNDI